MAEVEADIDPIAPIGGAFLTPFDRAPIDLRIVRHRGNVSGAIGDALVVFDKLALDLLRRWLIAPARGKTPAICFDHRRLCGKAFGQGLNAGDAGGFGIAPAGGLLALRLLGIFQPGGVLTLLLTRGQYRIGKVGIARKILAVFGAVNIFDRRVRQ
ncbi:hypothetical protein [Rhizobium leguminosarum]|uniref:hypothetical protein n=1 Tax=Rhizobium leguminosarum TaxID=384 RepID=UPI003F95867B